MDNHKGPDRTISLVLMAFGSMLSGVVHANAVSVDLDVAATGIIFGNQWSVPSIDISSASPDPLRNIGDTLEVTFNLTDSSGTLASPRILLIDTPPNNDEFIQILPAGVFEAPATTGTVATMGLTMEFLNTHGDFDGAVPVPVNTVGLASGIPPHPGFSFSTGNRAAELTDTSFSFDTLRIVITLDNLSNVDPQNSILFDSIAMDISANQVQVVPIPAAAWLFGSALGLLGLLRRRKAGH